jgi:hypothetical protein
MRPTAITARLRAASALADLRPDHRLDAKIDLSPQAITDRLKSVSALRDLCARIAVASRPARPA